MDEGEQTEEVFGASGSWDKPKLSMEDVPFFSRPSFMSPADRLVGFTESGQPVRESAIAGQMYSVTLNPDQRTTRTKIEEDVIPAVEDWFDDPSLPSMSQVAKAVKQMGSGAVESFEKAVKGTGTFGDVFGLAGGAGAISAGTKVPEGALRIFGGYSKAQDPGKTLSGEKAPVSKGLEGKLRFEIDDSQAKVYPFELKTANSKAPDFQESLENFQDGQLDPSFTPFIDLDRVLEHPELYNQYPELKEYAVFIDSDLSPLTLGYFNPDKGVIALNKNLMDNPESVKSTLLHEVQHWVQEEEGFSTGANQLSPEVSKKASPVIQKNRQIEEQYRKEITDKINPETASEVNRKVMDFLVDVAEQDGHTLQDMLEASSTNFKGDSWSAKFNFDRLLDETEALREATPDPYTGKSSFRHAFQLGKLDWFLKEAAQLAEKTGTQESFKDILGVSPKEYISFNRDDRRNFTDSLFGIKTPKVDIKDPSYYFYRTKGGEVESRNVQSRMGMSLEERAKTTPTETEDVIRGEQWTGKEGFAEGGSVEKQMSRMYQEGGLQDDGARIEPVTGNEVPPGSMDQEVRDNIPAQLSEGEYVVPADVVRYYGVKFFEDLRGQAKQDFARMEAEGRVGGEPVDFNGVPMEQDEELTPEEMAMLQEALGESPTGMYQGGMVPQQQQMQYNPYEQQQMQYSQPMFQSSRTGMQEGGLAEEAAKGYTGPTFDPSQYSYGGGFSSPFGGDTSTTSSRGMEIKEYINPETGQTRMITVLNGEPIGLVPDGFIPASQEAKQQAQEKKQEVETKTEGARVGMGGKDSADVGPEAPEAPDFSEMSPSELSQAHSNITGPEKTMANMLGAVPGVGRLAKAVNTKMKKDVEAEMAKRNMEVPEEEEVSLMDTISSIFSGKKSTGVPSAATSAGLSREAFGSDEAFGQAMAEAAPKGMSVSRDEEGNITGYSRSPAEAAPSKSARPRSRPSPGPTGGTGSGGSGGSSGGSGGSGGPGPGGEPGGPADRAEGGLMGKPEGSQNKKRKPNQRKKPIKNRKGLASK